MIRTRRVPECPRSDVETRGREGFVPIGIVIQVNKEATHMGGLFISSLLLVLPVLLIQALC